MNAWAVLDRHGRINNASVRPTRLKAIIAFKAGKTPDRCFDYWKERGCSVRRVWITEQKP